MIRTCFAQFAIAGENRLLRWKGQDDNIHSATMSESSFTPSCYGAMFQPFQDVYDPWYQQSGSYYDYAQQQEPTRPVNDQYLMEPNQPQDSYDQRTSYLRQNHHLSPSTSDPPSAKQSQRTPSGRMTYVLMEDRDGKPNRNGDNVFRRRSGACTRCKQVKMKCDFTPGEKTCQRCKPKGYHCVVEPPKPKV